MGEWAQQPEEKLGSAGRCGPLAQSGRVGPSSSHDQGARASGRGISVPGTVFAQIEGQQARSNAVTSHLCEPEPALPPPWATVLSSAHAADQMQLLLVRPVRSSTTQSGQTNIGCRGPRGAALRGRDAGPEHGTSADGTATHTAAAPLAPRGRCPPRPRAGPPPARLSGGTTHLVARGGRGQGWAQRGCAFRRGRGSAASSAGRTSGEQGRAGEGERGEGRRAPLLLTSSRAGSSPRGGAWQGTALLCVAGPVCSAPRRRPPSRQRGRPFY